MLNFECASEVRDSDLTSWVKRFDRDNDLALSFTDMANALQILTNYERRDPVAIKPVLKEP